MAASSPKTPKTRRVRVYTRFGQALRVRLHAFCEATGRSERAVIEEAVERFLANPGKGGASPAAAIEKLAQAIDEDRRQRELEHRDLELLSAAFGRFLRSWFATTVPGQDKGAAALEKFLRGLGEAFAQGQRFGHEVPGVSAVSRSHLHDRG